jgi:hypothetical protein
VPNQTRARLAKKEVATRFTGEADATPGAWRRNPSRRLESARDSEFE